RGIIRLERRRMRPDGVVLSEVVLDERIAPLQRYAAPDALGDRQFGTEHAGMPHVAVLYGIFVQPYGIDFILYVGILRHCGYRRLAETHVGGDVEVVANLGLHVGIAHNLESAAVGMPPVRVQFLERRRTESPRVAAADGDVLDRTIHECDAGRQVSLELRMIVVTQ